MSKVNGKSLNKYDKELQIKLEDLMKKHEVNFSAFLPTLRSDLPDKNDKTRKNEYNLKYRAEYLKFLRASFSVIEIKNMIAVLGYKLIFTKDGKEIDIEKYSVDDVKIKYTELVVVCELFDIKINWVEAPMEPQLQNNSNIE